MPNACKENCGSATEIGGWRRYSGDIGQLSFILVMWRRGRISSKQGIAYLVLGVNGGNWQAASKP